MNTELKRKILNHPTLYTLFVNIGNLRYFFKNTTSIKGRNNTVHFGAGVLRKKVRIKIIGHNNTLTIHPNCRLKNTTINIMGSNNHICLEEKIMVYEHAIFTIEGSDGSITVGNNTTIGSANLIIGEGNTSIAIGSDCMLSRDIVMNTSDYHSILSTVTHKRINPPKSIVVKNHVWIGNNAYISKGAVVGNNCIVASRAYVSSTSFEDHTILGGLPAKHLKGDINWSREKLPYEIV